VPDVMPKSTKYGEMPSEERREIMRWCWGRYDIRIPSSISLECDN